MFGNGGHDIVGMLYERLGTVNVTAPVFILRKGEEKRILQVSNNHYQTIYI
jgi:hypothetical protein